MSISLIKDIYSDIERSILTFKVSKSGVVRDVEEYGFHVESGFLPGDDCVILAEEIDRLLGQDETNVWVDDEGADKRIYGMEAISEAIGKKIDSRRIFDLAESYLGKRITHYFVLGARLDCAGGNKGSGGGWHRDSAFSHQFKAIIYLTDTDANSGPFQYLRGSHTSISKIKFFGFGETQSKTRYSDSEMVDLLKYCEEFNAPKGTAIFADTRGVHRGKPIFLGRRYALTYYLWTKSPPSDFGELLQREPSLVV